MTAMEPQSSSSPRGDSSIDDFYSLEIRAGTIVRAEVSLGTRNRACILWIDFGRDMGTRKSSAQISDRYDADHLVGRQVVCVTNIPPRQIGTMMSEVLVTGFVLENREVVLAVPDAPVPDGTLLR
jgi:tRNA-binding protein